jgi:16S rRNA (cytosine1402-N4)-methyltransferase
VSAGSEDLSLLHRPVLVPEVLEHLAAEGRERSLVVDGTVGYGGHAEAMLSAWPSCRLFGLDRDLVALQSTKTRLARFGARVRLFHASYADLPEVLEEAGEGRPDAVLLDLGVSSPQLDVRGRGFSFRAEDDPADMRFDASSDAPTAADFVNRTDERELARVIFEDGGERRARAVARALVAARPVRIVRDLVLAIQRVVPRDASGLHPATRTFQALRIAVNDERGHLRRGLEAALAALAPGGRLAVISFHSGEEHAVKEAFRAAQATGRARVVTTKGVRPTEEELAVNPRASSARLRVVEAVAGSVAGSVA